MCARAVGSAISQTRLENTRENDLRCGSAKPGSEEVSRKVAVEFRLTSGSRVGNIAATSVPRTCGIDYRRTRESSNVYEKTRARYRGEALSLPCFPKNEPSSRGAISPGFAGTRARFAAKGAKKTADRARGWEIASGGIERPIVRGDDLGKCGA